MYLNACFTQIQPHRQILPCEHIRILCLLERALQLMQLKCCESCARSAGNNNNNNIKKQKRTEQKTQKGENCPIAFVMPLLSCFLMG